GGALVGHRPLGHQVVDVLRPVLDGGVADAAVLESDQLNHRAVQRVGGVDGRRAAFDVVDEGTLVGDDQGPLELAHVLGVDPEVGLQRDLHLNPRRHVDERTAAPDGRVQGGKLVVGRGDDLAEPLLDELRVLPERRVGVGEDHALLRQLFLHAVVYDFGLILGGNAGQELALRLRDAQALEVLLDVLGHLVPGPALLLGGTHVVIDLVEIQVGQVRAPVGHRLLAEDLQGPQADLRHPLGLLLHPGDLLDDLFAQTLARLEHIIRGVAETPPLFVIGVKVLQLAGHTPPPPDRCSAGIFENLSLFVSHLNTGRTGPAIQFPAYYTPAWTRRPMRVTPGVKDALQELARP